MKNRIFVIGSSNVDMIMELEHLPAVGETVTGGVFLQTYGGKGANQAVAAARAGDKTTGATSVTFLTAVGNDAFGPIVVENFRQDGIDTERILVTSDVPTGSALVMFDKQGDNYLAVAPGANYTILPEHIDACDDLIRDAAIIVLQMEILEETTLAVMERAAAHKTPVLFNFAPARSIERIPITDRITGLIVNENEASALTGLTVDTAEAAEAAAQQLRARGPEFVVVTLGADGALIISGEATQHVPAFRVTPKDSTAAGDAFCGALAVALVEGKPLLKAVQFAQATAAISVTRMGAQPSLPYRPEIEDFLAAHTLLE